MSTLTKAVLFVEIDFQPAGLSEGQQEPAGIECGSARRFKDHLAIVSDPPEQAFGVMANAVDVYAIRPVGHGRVAPSVRYANATGRYRRNELLPSGRELPDEQIVRDRHLFRHLLHEERDTFGCALVSNCASPCRVHEASASPSAALAAADHPIGGRIT
jgi:hypothetical protein